MTHSDRVCRADFGCKTTRFRVDREDHGNQLIPVIANPRLAYIATVKTQGSNKMRPAAVLLLSPYLSNPYRSSVPAYMVLADIRSSFATLEITQQEGTAAAFHAFRFTEPRPVP